MSNISVHDTKEEGKGGGCEESRVGLTIPGDTIRVDKLLVTIGELVGGKVRRRSRPRFGHLINVTGHIHVHIRVSAVDGITHIVSVFCNDPTFTTEHTRYIRFEHVEGVVDGLLTEDGPCPLVNRSGKQLTKTETSILILQKNSAGIHKLLGILREHTIHRRSIVHIRKRIAMSRKCITNSLQLCLDTQRFVKDNKDTLLNLLSTVRIRDRLLNLCKSHKAVTSRRSENHSLKPNLFIGCHYSGDG
mmetsp:Transcript_30324/g.44288  ORF Transcript_30324/g.44288 Transcript_30324/m.44288 type:complete len:246 (-) Transcript_30324:619-1356(-)